jgi:hypothetical protein
VESDLPPVVVPSFKLGWGLMEMSRKRFAQEQTIGKIEEAEMALSAIY